LLSPSAAFVAWTSDKHRTTLRLEQCGVRVPFGRHIETGQRLSADFPYPAIAKPIDGAGSFDTRRIENAAAASQWGVATRPWRLERFIPGLPASVATLCGPGRRQMLPACSQCISQDGEFRYLGGRTPLPTALDRRAQTLAAQALAAFAEPLVGYVGVDLILGPAEDGSEDFVLEINPRLTTSYVGLRRLCRTNLAAAMLAIATGEPVELAIDDCHVEFDSAGSVRLGRWRTTEPGW
jgi:predicted ATP-grasp superfamily ATP-dependent carboligase